jgi:hypothetical protein
MNLSTKNIFTNQNVSISNSIILNNYSIQNLIFSTPNINNIEKIPLNTTNFKGNLNNIKHSPTPKKTMVKRNKQINKKTINNNYTVTPLPSNKSVSRLNCYNIRRIPILRRNIEITPKIIPLSYMTNIKEKKEKTPEDSIKKDIVKKKLLNTHNNKTLKCSMSSKILNSMKKPIFDRYDEKSKKSVPHNSLSKKKIPLNTKKNSEPKEKIILNEFKFGKQIGKGTFGKIFSVKWSKNNKCYAMKREILTDFEDVQKRKSTSKIIQNLTKNNENKGVIKLYGNLCLKKNKDNKENNNNNNNNNDITEFIYYELMEKAERDWNNEIIIRSRFNLYYTENEIINIMTQLIETLSFLEKNHITHRDIKPQNILIFNGKYKLCDFGEIRILKRDGLIVQRVRGSELYMSPILFHGLHSNLLQVRHNTYKSDVFSLGMCLFYASSLTYSGVDSIRELTDMKTIKEILFKYLKQRYSNKLINFIFSMLEVDENKRPNFIQLEKNLNKIFNVVK